MTRPDGHVNVSRLSSIVDQLAMLHAAGHKLILVSSGAVACGRGEMHAVHPLDSVEQRQLYSAMGQVKLMNLYYSLFREYGINVGQVLTMKENFISERQYKNQKSCISVMIENNIIPIVNENDTVSITELMFTDNDELSGLMARMMHADNLILLTNVDGVLGSPNPDGKQPTIRTVSSSDEVLTVFSACVLLAVAARHLPLLVSRRQPPDLRRRVMSCTSLPMSVGRPLTNVTLTALRRLRSSVVLSRQLCAAEPITTTLPSDLSLIHI